MNCQYNQTAHIFMCIFVFLCLPSGENPSCSHIMAASSLLNCHSDWQTVPHALLKHTSTLPVTYSRALPLSTPSGGDTSLISPSVQFEGKTLLPAIVARARWLVCLLCSDIHTAHTLTDYSHICTAVALKRFTADKSCRTVLKWRFRTSTVSNRW